MIYEIRGKYQVIQEIGNGKFGIVYKGKTKKNDFVAIKFDYTNLGILKHETSILNYLQQHCCKYIPLVYWYGLTKEPRNQELDIPCLIIPFYECSLTDYMKTKEITIKETATADFVMESSATELKEVIVTGVSTATEQQSNPVPVGIVTNKEMLQNSATNIIDAIATQPGVSQDIYKGEQLVVGNIAVQVHLGIRRPITHGEGV